jgi:release factor glutamine methyltransferase
MAEAESGAERRESWSIARVLRWAADDFRRRGLDSPRLDAEVLLADVLGVDRVRLVIEADRPLEERELALYRERIQRRRRFEPVAYIVGHREFYGLDFRVDRRVLVPRPDTETLVEVALARTRATSMYGQMLDLCTGSGCVAIALAKQRPTWRVTGVDISGDAVELARHNALRLGVAGSVSFVSGDLFAPLAPEARFDLLTANPPYIERAALPELPADIRDFEPRVAVDGGLEGLDVIKRIIEVMGDRLEAGGVVALEVGSGQAARVAALLEARGLSSIERRRDYGGIERVVSARRA